MLRTEIIKKIEDQEVNEGLTILRSERFKKYPLKSTWFYFLVAVNRYTPLLIPIKTKTTWGDKIEAYETSAIGSIYFLGFYDGDISLFLLKYFKEQGDLIDVGSNIGYYTSLFTQIAAPEAKIFALEPTPSTYQVLQKNVSDLPSVHTDQIALSDKSGTTYFYDYGNQHGVYNSTSAQSYDFLQGTEHKIEVQTETLDNWVTRTRAKPSLMKLDTEGTESTILKNGQNTLTTYSPLILLEVGGGEAWSQNIKECFDILLSHDYSFFELSKKGDLIPHQQQETYAYKNLVCIPKNKLTAYVQPS